MPLTLAPRTARRLPPTSGQLTSSIVVRDAGDVGGTVPVQVSGCERHHDGLPHSQGGDHRHGRERVGSRVVTRLRAASSTTLWPLTCTVNLPAGKSRVVNVVLRAPSTGVGNITAEVFQS